MRCVADVVAPQTLQGLSKTHHLTTLHSMATCEDRTKGFSIALDYSSDARTEIDHFLKNNGKAIIPLTVREILDEQIAKKLA